MDTKDTKYNPEYLYIMDFSDGTINEVKLQPEDKDIDSEELLDKYGFKTSQCNWMFTTHKIDNINEVN